VPDDQDEELQDEELPPLSVLVDMLDDVVKQLDTVDDFVIRHRRAAGDDHITIERLSYATARIGQAWTGVVLARKVLRSDG